MTHCLKLHKLRYRAVFRALRVSCAVLHPFPHAALTRASRPATALALQYMDLLAESPEARRQRERNTRKAEQRRLKKEALARRQAERLGALSTARAMLCGRVAGPVLPRGGCSVGRLMRRLLAEAAASAGRGAPSPCPATGGAAAPMRPARAPTVLAPAPSQRESVPSPSPSVAPAADAPDAPVAAPASNLFELLDLCTGLGGFVVGLRSIITRVLAYCELDDKPVAILKTLLLRCQIPQPVCAKPIFPDVRTLLADPVFQELMKVDHRDDPLLRVLPLLLSAGWPCQVRVCAQRAQQQHHTDALQQQDNSPANHQRQHGRVKEKSGLLTNILAICVALRPDMIVLENVPAGWSEQGAEIEAALVPLGYTVCAVEVSALELGFLHNRNRLFVVAVLTSSHFMHTIRHLPSTLLSSLIPARVPYSRTKVTSTRDIQQYATRRDALGKAVVPAQLLLGVQRGLADCLGVAQPPQPDPLVLNPGRPAPFLVDPFCYDPPDGWSPPSNFNPDKLVRVAYTADHHPALRTGISNSHNLSESTDHDFDTNCRFASITAPGERGVDWRVALPYVEALMGLEPGWTSIDDDAWAALGKRSGEGGQGRRGVKRREVKQGCWEEERLPARTTARCRVLDARHA